MFKKILIIAFFLPLSSFGYYNPGVPAGLVNDFAGIFGQDQKVQLETKLSNFEKESSNEVSIVIIPSLRGDTIENFAEKLFKEWGVGKKDRDNGILLLVALEDRKMRIEVGYGLEGALTDAQSYSIIKNTLTPAFKRGDYFGGINSAVDDIILATKGEYVTPTVPSSWPSGINLEWVFYSFFFLIWFSSALARSKSWWAGGVVGGIFAVVDGLYTLSFFVFIISLVVFIPFGLLLDFVVSRAYQKGKTTGHYPWWIGGGPHGGGWGSSSSGGFGGFGGGHSGGGGSSGSW